MSVSVLVKAKDEKSASIGACTYIGDLGIECMNVKLEYTDKQLKAEIKEGCKESDLHDWNDN